MHDRRLCGWAVGRLGGWAVGRLTVGREKKETKKNERNVRQHGFWDRGEVPSGTGASE